VSAMWEEKSVVGGGERDNGCLLLRSGRSLSFILYR
jgi:hypothetical protein